MVLRRVQLGHDDLAVLAEVGGQADHAEALGPVAAMTPPVLMLSSSGWAWMVRRVRGRVMRP